MANNVKLSFIHGRETVPYKIHPRPEGKIILESISDEESNECPRDIERSASQSSIRSQGTFSGTCAVDAEETANVYLRIRPVELDSILWRFRIEMGDTFVAANIENAQTKNKNTIEQHYKFNHVFDDYTSQIDIYNKCVKPLISLEDSATIMVYGTSGSGKTHTLLGESCNPGLVPRALSQLFVEYGNNISNYPIFKLRRGVPIAIPDDQIYQEEVLKNLLLNSMTDSQTFVEMLQKLKIENNFEAKFIENFQMFLWVSFIEIYNEEVYDLLAYPINNLNPSPKRNNLKVISNHGQPFVRDASQIFVSSFEETIKILQYGMSRVSTGSTIINERSSRSHCIFFVDIIKRNRSEMTSTSYKFCDLAGSERLKKTENIGKRLKEAKNINKSLMTLGRCLAMANERQKNKFSRIPYRDSKLTTLLQNALLGHEKISLIVTLNPKLDYIEENLNVLNFASIAKEIIKSKETNYHKRRRTRRYSLFLSTMLSPSSILQQTDASINDFKQQINDLVAKNSELENEITRLQNEMVQQEIMLRKSIVGALDIEYQRTVEHFDKQIVALKMCHKSRVDHLENCIKQIDRSLQHKDKLNSKLKAQILQLQQSNNVVPCDDSETESDDTNESD